MPVIVDLSIQFALNLGCDEGAVLSRDGGLTV
jgi:hypothetical protein